MSSQKEAEIQLAQYKSEAMARVAEADAKARQADERAAEANAMAEIAKRDAAVALAAAAVADQKGAEAKLAAAYANERAAVANERAVAAGLQAGEASRGVSNITSLRSLGSAQAHNIVAALKRYVGTPFTLSVSERGPDGLALAEQVINALSQSGWAYQDWSGGGPGYVLSGIHRVGTVNAIGVIIIYFPDQTSKYFQAAKDLARLLNTYGIIAATQAANPPTGTSQDALEIAVGSKPL